MTTAKTKDKKMAPGNIKSKRIIRKKRKEKERENMDSAGGDGGNKNIRTCSDRRWK